MEKIHVYGRLELTEVNRRGLYVAPAQDVVFAWFGTHDERGSAEVLTIATGLATNGLFQ